MLASTHQVSSADPIAEGTQLCRSPHMGTRVCVWTSTVESFSWTETSDVCLITTHHMPHLNASFNEQVLGRNSFTSELRRCGSLLSEDLLSVSSLGQETSLFWAKVSLTIKLSHCLPLCYDFQGISCSFIMLSVSR